MNDDVGFVLDIYALLDFCSASSPTQQFARRLVAPYTQTHYCYSGSSNLCYYSLMRRAK